MKTVMFVVNLMLCIGSILGVAGHIINGQFGIAWIAAVCVAYTLGNLVAIE